MKDAFTTKYQISKYQCRFREVFNAKHCRLSIIEKCKETVDNSGSFGALMTDCSKDINC